jgi:RNA polymerase sigma-70 factor (ECF subfamily)
VADFSPWMQRVARKHVHSDGLAEDIVQETWLAVLRELDTFRGRSSLTNGQHSFYRLLTRGPS